MTKLTYKIETFKGTVLKRNISTLAEAKELAAALNAKYTEEYTPYEPPKVKFDRSKCKKSEEWLARHAE